MSNYFTRKPTVCPSCGAHLDAATRNGNDGGPKEGDLSLCVYCEQALRFTAELEVRALTDDELAALDKSTQRSLERNREMVRRLRQIGFFGLPGGKQ